jgi:hypothetical protein
MMLRLHMVVVMLCALILAPKRLLLYFNRWVCSVEDMRWRRMMFPLVRAAFPALCAHDLVSVQPMREPSGTVFYMDFRQATPTYNPAEVYSERVKRSYQVEAPVVIYTHDKSS